MKKLINNIFIQNFIPVILLHLIFSVLWIFTNKNNDITGTTNVTMLETISDLVIVPVYLLIVNFRLCLKLKKYSFLLNFVLMEISAFLGNIMHYFNWGLTTGLLKNPDPETISIFKAITSFDLIAILIVSIVMQIVLVFRRKASKSKEKLNL